MNTTSIILLSWIGLIILATIISFIRKKIIQKCKISKYYYPVTLEYPFFSAYTIGEALWQLFANIVSVPIIFVLIVWDTFKAILNIEIGK